MKARPDVEAAMRGGDWDQPMNGEGPIGDATINQALYWRQIYSEILAMEEQVLVHIRQLMVTQSDEGRREVELTNVPTKARAATIRTRTARDDRGRGESSAFAIPHTHGRTSCIRARQKISVTFWESSGDAGQGRSSMASSASRRGRTTPSSASSPMTRLLLSLNRSLSATIGSGISLRSN